MLDSLPVELLMYLLTFVTDTRDRVRLSLVSRKLRSAMETPSLWRDFCWPFYNPNEEQTIVKILKSYGRYIETLSFPDDVPSTAPDIFSQYCNHVTTLCIPTCGLQSAMLKVVVRHMRGLQNLDVGWSTDMRELLSLSDTLTDVTIRMQNVIDHRNLELDAFLHDWINKGFQPENVKIFCNCSYAEILLTAWNSWNDNSPIGKTGCVKVYDCFKPPLNLYPALPIFQLQFGRTASLPILDASKLFIARGNYTLLLTECSYGSKAIYKTDMWYPGDIVHRDRVNCNVDDLQFVTDIDFSNDDLFRSDQLEQVALMCPSLQRLGLSNKSLNSLQGLRAIAASCNNLQGLNLLGIQVAQVEDQLQLWEILSNLKLTHLAMELCVMMRPLQDETHKQFLISLFQKCVQLQALQLELAASVVYCPDCYHCVEQDVLLLGHFPLLTYCKLTCMEFDFTFGVQHITYSCTKLRYLSYTSRDCFAPMSLQHINVQCLLHQLFIESDLTDIPDMFMNAVSVHGELEHVVLCVRSVTREGITSLIANSSQLLTLHVITRSSFLHDTRIILRKRFHNRKLFTIGSFKFGVLKLSRSILQPNIDVTSSLW